MGGLAMESDWNWLMLAIPIAVVVVCIVQLGWLAYRRRGSDSLSATVVGHRTIDDTDEGPQQVAVLAFMTDGKSWKVEDRMAVRPGTYRVGQSVHMLVPRHDPAQAYISRPWQNWLVGVVLVAGLFFLWVAYRSMIKA